MRAVSLYGTLLCMLKIYGPMTKVHIFSRLRICMPHIKSLPDFDINIKRLEELKYVSSTLKGKRVAYELTKKGDKTAKQGLIEIAQLADWLDKEVFS